MTTIDDFIRRAYADMSLVDLEAERAHYRAEALTAAHTMARACATEDADLMDALIADRLESDCE